MTSIPRVLLLSLPFLFLAGLAAPAWSQSASSPPLGQCCEVETKKICGTCLEGQCRKSSAGCASCESPTTFQGNKPWTCRGGTSCCWLETTYVPNPPKDGDHKKGESRVPGQGGGGAPGGGGLSFKYVKGPCGGMLSTQSNVSYQPADPAQCN